jgi:hypothetical protein
VIGGYVKAQAHLATHRYCRLLVSDQPTPPVLITARMIRFTKLKGMHTQASYVENGVRKPPLPSTRPSP